MIAAGTVLAATALAEGSATVAVSCDGGAAEEAPKMLEFPEGPKMLDSPEVATSLG